MTDQMDDEKARRRDSHVVSPRSSATIHDVAAQAGVSISTVSKALNDQGKLRQETRERIKSIANRLGFRPNELAQSLLRKRSFSVGLLSNDNYGRFSMPIMEGVEEAMSSNNVAVFLCNGADDPDKERSHLESLIAKRVDGIILTARRRDRRFTLDLRHIGIPVLYVLAQSDSPDALCLQPDDLDGARTAVRHLIACGRRRIAHISGPMTFEAVHLRIQGYREALEEAGLAIPEGSPLSGVWSEAWGYQATTDLFTRPGVKPDAIFCGSDQIGRGVADCLRERGLTVPDDVALVGFDNWEILAAATRPTLTSIDANLREMGRQAGLTLLGQIQDGPRETGIRVIPSSLVIRESCGWQTLKSDKTTQK
jgi:LacI family transcriptional regulator